MGETFTVRLCLASVTLMLAAYGVPPVRDTISMLLETVSGIIGRLP